VTMAFAFGTDSWAVALAQEINASSEYRNAAAKWGDGFNGNVLLVFDADATLPKTRSLLVRLATGSCGGATFTDGATHPDAGFGLKAPFSIWRDILERKTLAATAILTGKMKVEGDRMTLLKHTAAHRALIACAAAIDTEFPSA
jgi:putative sterol carrier protein